MSEPVSSPESEQPKNTRIGDFWKATIMVAFVLAAILAMGGFTLFGLARKIDKRDVTATVAEAAVDKSPNLSPDTVWLLQAFDQYPWVGILLVLMLADVVTGLLAGVVLKRISSKVSWAGMSKKAIVMILVGVCAVIERQAGGIPLAKLVASAFTISELISIVENASRSGIIIPKPLADYITTLLQKPAASKHSESLHIDNVTAVVKVTAPPAEKTQ